MEPSSVEAVIYDFVESRTKWWGDGLVERNPKVADLLKRPVDHASDWNGYKSKFNVRSNG